MKLMLSIIVPLLFMTGNLWAQHTIQGKVRDKQTNLPMSGVTVKIKHQPLATTTDSAGFFKLSYTADKAILEISHIGYQILETESGRGVQDYFLQPSVVVMEDVTVSTGYQQLSKERSTGSFDQIDYKLLQRSASSNILDRLEKISSGVFFSKDNSAGQGIFVRGINSLQNGSSDPLIILDNFPYTDDINNINPNDIENITILKDAAASSIWGARAGNGVIVITTKKGRYSQPIKLTLNSTFTREGKPDVYKDKSYMSSEEFIGVERFLFSNGFYDSDLSNTYYYPAVSPVVELLYAVRTGTLSEAEADKQISKLSENDLRKDMMDYVYRTAISQQYSLALSGGSERVSYNMSTGFDKNETTLVGTGNTRKTITSAIKIKPVKKLELNSSVNYSSWVITRNGLDNSELNPGYNKTNLYPYARLVDDLGNSISTIKDHRIGYTDSVGNGLLKDWHFYPLEEINNREKTWSSQNTQMNLGLKFDFSNDLIFQLLGQYENIHKETRELYYSDSYYARNRINQFTNIANGLPVLNLPDGDILDRIFLTQENYGFRAQANYNSSFQNERHIISLMAGAEARQNQQESQGARTYGYDRNKLTFSDVDYLTDFTYYNDLGSGKIDSHKSFSSLLDRYLSAYANGSYTYKQYTLTGSMRKDASNLFGVNTNQKWNPFWSGGLSWKLSDELFYNLRWMPYLKLRATYGSSGNINNGMSALAVIEHSSSATVTGLPFARSSQPANPDLTWEKTHILNIGADFGTRNHKISGSAEYYTKKSTNLFSYVNLDPTTGVSGSSMILNAAGLSTHGVDVKLNFLQGFGELKWNGTFLFNYVKSKVTDFKFKFPRNAQLISNGRSINTALTEGQDAFALVLYKWGGLNPETGSPRGFIDGELSEDYIKLLNPESIEDLVVKGTGRAPLFGSFLNSFQYHGFGLSANIYFQFGYYYKRRGLEYAQLFSSWAMNSEFTQRWQKPGDEKYTNVPSMIYPANSYRDQFYYNSEAMIERGDHIRLEDIRLSYDFQFKNNKPGTSARSLQLFIYASNFGIIWKASKMDIDPEYHWGLPPARKYSFGLKANF